MYRIVLANTVSLDFFSPSRYVKTFVPTGKLKESGIVLMVKVKDEKENVSALSNLLVPKIHYGNGEVPLIKL